MAHFYGGAVATPAAAAGAAYATLAANTATRTKIFEIGLFCNAATASSIGLYRPTNTFVATTNALTTPDDPADEMGETSMGTAWSTAPTIGANVAIRRILLPAAIGAGVIWQWPQGLIIGVAGVTGLVIWNFGGGAGSVLQMYINCDD